MTTSEKTQPKLTRPLRGATELFQETISLYRREFSLLFGYAAWLLIPITLSFLAGSILTDQTAAIVDFAIFTLYLILAIWIVVIIILLTPIIQTGKKFKLKNIGFRAWRVALPFFLTSIVVVLINTVGTLALIIPGIIFGVWFSFSGVIVAFKEIGIFAALKESRELSRNRFWPVLWRLISGFFLIGGLYLLALWCGVLIIQAIGGHNPQDVLTATPGIAEQTYASVVDVFFLPLFVMYHTILFIELVKNDKAS